MGAGRKTETVVLQKKPPPQWNSNSNPYSARNLSKKDLAGVVLGCKHSTFKECMSKLLFGLPAAHFQYVKNVTQGLTVFLFNYSDRKLHGIFEAISVGQMMIDPHAWTLNDQDETQFPAQVRVKVRMPCVSLTEDQFQPILAKNYRLHDPNHFWFELDASQNEKLIALFSSFSGGRSVSSLHPAATQNTFQLLSVPGAYQENGSIRTRKVDMHSSNATRNGNGKQIEEGDMDHDAPKKHGNVTSSFQGKTWSSLFNTVIDSIPKEKCKYPKEPALEVHVPCQNHFEMLCDTSCSELFPDGENEGFKDLATRGNSNEVVEQISGSVPNSEYSAVDAMPSLSEIFDQIAQAADMLDDGEVTMNVASDEYLSIESNMEWASSLPVLHLDSQIEMPEDPFNVTIYEEGHMIHKPCSEGSNYSAMLGFIDMEENAFQDASVLTEANSGGTCFSEGIMSPMERSDLGTVVTKLIQTIREMKSLQLTQDQKIQKLKEELVESNRQIEELRYHLGTSAPSLSSLLPGHGKETESQQCRQDSEQCILLVGGFDGFSWMPDLDSYLPSKDVMHSLEPMTSARSYVSAVVLNGGLYVLGGGCETSWYNTVELYNLKSNRWLSCPSLNNRKGSLAGACSNDKIFAIGGGNATGCLAEVEMLDPNIGKWIFTCSMTHKRFSPTAAQMNGVLYVAGGYDGQEYLKSLERLDPREYSWTRLKNMTTKRGCHSLEFLNEKLYAIGGFDGCQMVQTVEVFEPRVGSWMMSEPMKSARGCMGAITVGNNILVMGGTRGDNEILDTVECYSEGEGWRLTDAKSVRKRCFFSAIVV